MVFGGELQLPNVVLLATHLALLVLGVWLFRRARIWSAEIKGVAYFFSMFSASELLYVLARINVLAVSLANQVGEILVLIGAIAAIYSLWRSKK